MPEALEEFWPQTKIIDTFIPHFSIVSKPCQNAKNVAKIVIKALIMPKIVLKWSKFWTGQSSEKIFDAFGWCLKLS